MMDGKVFIYIKMEEIYGSFRNDLKNGYGVYKWTDGDVYKGNGEMESVMEKELKLKEM